ncbi:MAG TPA: hypothetical protein VMD56_09975 [Steroidobacteraceae bacterium]|nr:hypothetical protein [Steroidobacteraceae bacterium]
MRAAACALAALMTLAALVYADAARAQFDLSGNWVGESSEDPLEHTAGGYPDMFAGIPVNENGRQAGLTAPGDVMQELNRQCEPWPAHYLLIGPWGGRFAALRDAAGQVIAWTLSSPAYDRLPMTIWMDGRSPPPALSLHTYAGYSVGRWEGDTLVISTSLLKDGYLLDNGMPSSNRETDTFFLTRYGDEMTIMLVVNDPVYLEAPFVSARTMKLVGGLSDVNDPILYCMPAETIEGFTDGYHSAIQLPPKEAAQRTYLQGIYRLPPVATDGGARTMYPQFAKQLVGYKPPDCKLYCAQNRRVPEDAISR